MVESADLKKDLSCIIRETITSRGKITFREFMELALYHPALGYYMSDREKIGWVGDFYTSPDVHRVFGVSLMKQLAEMRGLLSSEDRLNIIEVGGGNGDLCLQLLSAAIEREPELYDSIRYVMVDKSPKLRSVQKGRVNSDGRFRGKVSWDDEIETLLDKIDSAVVISNELIDAFPVHRVVYEGGGWRELFVTAEGESFKEVSAPLSDERLETFLSKLEGPFEEGYSTEVNLDALKWIDTVGHNLKKGFVVTIDYGYPREDYYSPLRNRGTLLCYHRHEICEDPYLRVGEQDITAHVDFTSLAEAGEAAGLRLTGYCDQFHFLMGLGIFDEFRRMDGQEGYDVDAYSENQAIKNLLMPGSMGGVFRVLIQQKGIGEKAELKAFSFRELSHRL